MPLYGYGAVKKMGTGIGPWVVPEKPDIRLPSVKTESSPAPQHHSRHTHPRRNRKREEELEAEEDARLIHAEYNAKLLEARAWHLPLTLPPFLPILYSDYILDEPHAIWRYDARDRWGGVDREVEGVWSTLKVRPLEERMGGAGDAVDEENVVVVVGGGGREGRNASRDVKVKKEEEDDAGWERDVVAKAVDEDEGNLKTLVKNLAERGAVRYSCLCPYSYFTF